MAADAVVEGYRRYPASLATDNAESAIDAVDEAAYETFENAIWYGPAITAWELVLRLLRTSTDEDLGLHAAGALEDVVRKHGVELVERVEKEAQREPRFRWALGCIWMSRGELPDEILDRVVLASGNEIKVFPPLSELADP